jgi:rhomboid protease GluP
MSPLDQPSETARPDEPEGRLVEAGVYPTYTDAFQHSLVVLAMGQACWIAPPGPGHRLLVEPPVLEAAREQLARFDRESVGWPPPPLADPSVHRKTEILTPLLWSLSVLAVFRLQLQAPGWTRAGALDTQAMFEQGEWWRAGTALFLHGDAAHVISNALSGIVAFSVLLSTVGRLRGWLLLALASILGNLAVAAGHAGREYRSVGASTAIFAALGLLTGRAIRVVCRADTRRRWRAVFVPAAAGLAVLGLYGAGGTNVDVPAHFTGFVAGVVLGFAAALPRPSSGERRG